MPGLLKWISKLNINHSCQQNSQPELLHSFIVLS
uniref:Uncharacterized protein n=1 Tax=Anguilla anguilla TaxID=7936 RepID=A0A0E9WJD0_ANGAN